MARAEEKHRQGDFRIGIDFGGTKIEAIAIDPAGRQLARERVATPAGDYGASLRAIADLVERIGRDLGVDPETFRKIGIGIPGAISPHSGLVKNANSVWLIGKPLQGDLESLLGRPVRIENDANCFTRSEAVDGAGAGARMVFGVILGTGVGGGLFHAGTTWAGANAIAGEWGHNPLPWPDAVEREGHTCYCGRAGCIETFLSGGALAADAGVPGRRDAAAVVARAKAGDRRAEGALERYEHRLARALAAVVNILDPDRIVLGGGLSNIDRLYRTVPPLMDGFVFSVRFDTPLLKALHGDSSGVRGAAWLWR